VLAGRAAGLETGPVGPGGAGRAIRHEIARLAGAEAVPAHRRAARHTSILAALRAAGADDDTMLACHAEAAGDRAAVLRYAPAAARRAAGLGAHREAAAQYERVPRSAGGQDPARRAASRAVRLGLVVAADLGCCHASELACVLV